MDVEVGGVKVRFISWPEAIGMSEALGRKVLESGFKPEIILAISRGGLVPARIISDVLDVDNIVTAAVKYWAVAERRAERPILYHGVEPSVIGWKKVLVVDEVADTGATFETHSGSTERHGSLRSQNRSVAREVHQQLRA